MEKQFTTEVWEGILKHIQPIGGHENITIMEIEPGHVKLSVKVTPEALNLYGNAHGGFLFSLCDIAAGMSTYAYSVPNVTQQGTINYFRGVKEGIIYINTTCLHKGRSTAVTRVDITDSNNRLVASATFSMFITGSKIGGDSNDN